MLKVKQKVQKVNFKGKTIEVGMDVHHNKWNISIFLEGQYLRTFQQPAAPDLLIAHLKREYPGADYKLAYEAGFCGFWICRKLMEAGMDCMVVNASDVPQTNKGLLIKNDSNDSRRLGEALSGGMLRGFHVPDAELESDRSLVRYRLRLQRDLVRCKVRIKSMLHSMGIVIPQRFDNGKWSQVFIEWLKGLDMPHHSAKCTLSHMIEQVQSLRQKQLSVMKNLRQLIQSPRYKKNYTLLQSVPGIGPITAITLLTETGDIRRFSNFYRFNSFIGFCPSEHSSGEKERKGSMTPRHHSPLREMLIEAAWVAVRLDPALSLAYHQWKLRMGGKRAIVKIARRLLNRIYCIWLKQIAYEKGIVQ